ncbi:hypothetical protein ACL9RL_06205 [Plantibacter sp. Mn2098]|uniref:hypothetical protein n=1 Tax=Plantibacter sp. Mn2098 TaxID=3395266 RepID=UPI003BCDD6F2
MLPAALAVTFAITVGSILFAAASPASAAVADPTPSSTEESSQTPSPMPTEPPSITSPSDGSLLDGGSTNVTGTKAQGSAIQLSLGAGTEPVCLIPADDSTSWSCSVSLSDGPGRTLRAVQTGADGLTQTTQVSVAVLSAPVITSGAVSNGGIRGTAYPGAEVTVTASRGGTCTFPADASGSWFCVLEGGLTSGEQTVVAKQRTNFSGGASSAPSAPFPITIDLDPPPAPTITSPVVGTLMPLSGSVYSGAGEERATVTVFAGSTSVCSAVVAGGVWSCTGGAVPEGPQLVIAIQQDPAGNTSGGSQAFTLRYSANPTGQNPSSSPSAAPSPTQTAPGQPSTTPGGQGQAGGSPTPTPEQTQRPQAGGAVPSTGGGGQGPWAGATPFTGSLAGGSDGQSHPSWWLAAILAVAALLLVAVPTRLLASTFGPTVRARAERRRMSVTGRNRAKAEFESAPSIRPPSTVVIAIATAVLASGFLILAHPVEGQPAYLRLWVASFAAIALINAAAIGAQLLAARFAKLGPVRVVPAPRWVIGIGVVSLISRTLGLQPALLLGLVFETKPLAPDSNGTDEATTHRHASAPLPERPAIAGWLGLSRIGAAALIGALAWVVSATTGAPVGAFQSFLAELVNVTAITGIGSAAIALLPIGSLGGLAVFRWSKGVWAAATVVAFTLLFALLGPTATVEGSTTTFTVVIVVVLVFAAVALSTWVWTRHLRPLFETAG